MNTMTQCNQILEALKEGPITSKQAADDYGVYRLAARVHDLRDAGYPIISKKIKVRNRNGQVCYVSEYLLAEK